MTTLFLQDDDDDDDDEDEDEDESSTSSPVDQNAVSRTPDSCVVTSSVDDGSKGNANAAAGVANASTAPHKQAAGNPSMSELRQRLS